MSERHTPAWVAVRRGREDLRRTSGGGFPGMAGITACSGSNNCPIGTVCCLHEIGMAEVQAIVCHADLAECRDGNELCSGVPGECRTKGTKCVGYKCVE